MKKLIIGSLCLFSFMLFSCNNIQSNRGIDRTEQKQTVTKEDVCNNIAKYVVIEREEPQPVDRHRSVGLNKKKEQVLQLLFLIFPLSLPYWHNGVLNHLHFGC